MFFWKFWKTPARTQEATPSSHAAAFKEDSLYGKLHAHSLKNDDLNITRPVAYYMTTTHCLSRKPSKSSYVPTTAALNLGVRRLMNSHFSLDDFEFLCVFPFSTLHASKQVI